MAQKHKTIRAIELYKEADRLRQSARAAVDMRMTDHANEMYAAARNLDIQAREIEKGK